MPYIVYSNSEGGFWNNDLGWIEASEYATRFTDEERCTFNLPLALDNDAEWINVER